MIHLDFKVLCPHLVTARMLSIEDYKVVLNAVDPSKAASYVLEKVDTSLNIGVGDAFDRFLSTLENCDYLDYRELAKQMKEDLLISTIGKA